MLGTQEVLDLLAVEDIQEVLDLLEVKEQDLLVVWVTVVAWVTLVVQDKDKPDIQEVKDFLAALATQAVLDLQVAEASQAVLDIMEVLDLRAALDLLEAREQDLLAVLVIQAAAGM